MAVLGSYYSYYSPVRNSITAVHLGFIMLTIMLEYTQARIGYFWHITDLHLDTIYSTQGDVMRSCWRIERQAPSSPSHAPGRYGDYLCDSPWSLIESATRAMKSRQGDNVEFVLWTGDGLSHSAHPMFESKKLEILRNITDLLGRTFSSQFVFPVLGHEDGTTTNFRHMGELWRHWLPSEALHTFEKGGYYSIEQTKSRLRIIALNTNFMRHDPKYSQSHLAAVRQRMPTNSIMGSSSSGSVSSNSNGAGDSKEYNSFYYHHGNLHQHHGHASDWSSAHNYGYGSHHRGISVLPNGGVVDGGGRVSALSEFENQDTEKQWTWLEEVLTKSKLNKETVYIVGHIPPGSDERHIGLQQNGHTTFTESNNKRYLDLVRKYSSIIQGQFFGHLHSDSFRIIYDDKGKPVSWMMISPSVTPRKMSVGSNNPAMRLYKFDTDSGQVLDYTQYYMDLQLANTLGEPNWMPEYNLTHYYALTDISAISLHNFVDRFTSSDGTWFAKYYRANTVRYQVESCEGVCMLNHYCAITRVDYKEFRQCLEKEQSALRSNAPLRHTDEKHLLLLTMTMLLLMMMTMTWNCARVQLMVKILQQCDKVITNCQQGAAAAAVVGPFTVAINNKRPANYLNAVTAEQNALLLSQSSVYTAAASVNVVKVREIVIRTKKKLEQHTCDNCLQRQLQDTHKIAMQQQKNDVLHKSKKSIGCRNVWPSSQSISIISSSSSQQCNTDAANALISFVIGLRRWRHMHFLRQLLLLLVQPLLLLLLFQPIRKQLDSIIKCLLLYTSIMFASNSERLPTSTSSSLCKRTSTRCYFNLLHFLQANTYFALRKNNSRKDRFSHLLN